METIFQNEFIEIQYDDANHWVYSNWQNYQTMESVQDGCEKILELLNEKKCTKILNDNRLVKGTWAFAAEWVGNVWFPRAIEAGLKQFAWIYSPDIFSKFSTDQSTKNTEGEVIQTFNDIKAGEEWLKSMP